MSEPKERSAEQEARRLLAWHAHGGRLRPFNGPCMICGGPDQRYRLADALVEMVGAGDSPEFVAAAYGLTDVTPETIRALVAIRERNRARHRFRWAL